MLIKITYWLIKFGMLPNCSFVNLRAKIVIRYLIVHMFHILKTEPFFFFVIITVIMIVLIKLISVFYFIFSNR